MMTRIRHWWTEFFMSEDVPYGMALVRIVLPLVLLVGVLPRWWHVRELYSADGTPTPIWVAYGSQALLPDLPAPVAVGLFSLLVFCLLTASLGWKTRLSLAIVTVLYTAFGIIDMVSTLTKYTVLASHALLLLSLSRCGEVWSADAWLQRRTLPSAIIGPPTASLWPCRLLQLLLAICYLGSAFTKMHTPAYFSGEQMQYWMLGNMNFENRVGEYLSLFPAVSVLGAYVTIVWEVLFVALIWRRGWRAIALTFGVVFHVLSSLMLGLIVFPLLCIALYLAFVEREHVERAALAVRSWVRRLRPAGSGAAFAFRAAPPAWLTPQASLATFGLLAALWSVAGTEVEHHLDVYRERTAAGPLPLASLDPQRAAAMLGAEKAIRPQDLFFSCDVGSTMLGGVLVDRKETFRTGETAVLQCNMTPPHPDMWVEVSLNDAQDRAIRRFGQVISREQLRSNFTYHFDDILRAGRYEFVVSYDGIEIARRPITYEPREVSRSSPPGLAVVH
jgi:hypothetical protein